MPSHKKIKTYSRPNSSLVNNSIDAYNLLYANKPKRVIGKRKRKNNYLIKELPSRPRCDPILVKEDSINVSTEDTFDKLFNGTRNIPNSTSTEDTFDNLLKGTRNIPKSTSPPNTVNISKSFNTLEPQCIHSLIAGREKQKNISKSFNISEPQCIHSPIATRQKRKKIEFNTTNSLKICETKDSWEQTHLRRLNETSKDKIEASIEVECVQNQQPNYSLSYIKVPTPLKYSKIAENKLGVDSSKLGISINYFTRNLHENFAAKCSTPVNPNKHLKSNLLSIEQKTPNKTFDSEFKNMTDSDIQFIDSSRDIKGSMSKLSDNRSNFFNLRNRKILKPNIRNILTASLEDFDRFEKQKNSFTTSLESFSKFQEPNLDNNSSRRLIYSLKTFESFENLCSPTVNFVTKRKIISKDKSSLKTSKDKKIFKEVVVKLDKLNMPEITNNSSSEEFDKSLASFEQFYNSNYSHIEDSEKCPHISTANDDLSKFEAKDKININESFENFYHSHYSFINSENKDDLPKNLTNNILEIPSKQNIIKELRINISKCSDKRLKDNIYNNNNPISVNCSNQTTFNDKKKLEVKLSKINVSNDKIECYKSNNSARSLCSHSTSNKQNNFKSDNEETQDVSNKSYDNITNNTNSSYQTNFSDNSNDKFECYKLNNSKRYLHSLSNKQNNSKSDNEETQDVSNKSYDNVSNNTNSSYQTTFSDNSNDKFECNKSNNSERSLHSLSNKQNNSKSDNEETQDVSNKSYDNVSNNTNSSYQTTFSDNSNDKFECNKSNNSERSLHSLSNKQNNSKSDNEETQDVSNKSYDNVSNNTNSSYQTTFSDNSNDKFECNKSNNSDRSLRFHSNKQNNSKSDNEETQDVSYKSYDNITNNTNSSYQTNFSDNSNDKFECYKLNNNKRYLRSHSNKQNNSKSDNETQDVSNKSYDNVTNNTNNNNKRTLRSHRTSNRQNNSKSDKEETQDLSNESYDNINNINSSYQTTFSNNSNLVEHVTADYNLDQFECNKSNNNDLQVDANDSNIEGKESILTDNFEQFYESNIEKYDFSLSTLGNDPQENISSQNESIDVIESSYIENLSLKENENNLLQIADISHMSIIKSDMPLNEKNKSSQSNTNSKMDTKNNSLEIVDVSQMAINKSYNFNIPKLPLKNIQLKSGKNWKRSLSIYKRDSMFYGFPKEQCCSPYLTKTCPKGKLSKFSNPSCNKRLSVCLVPVKPIIELENETSLLVEYAINPSYVPDQIIDDSLQDSFRCLSLNQRNSVNNKNQLNRLPVTAREVVLRRCGQTEPLEFSKCFPKSMLQHCHKIGEGVYGEVFLFRNPKMGTSVIKIVPVEGDLIVNGEAQKKFEEVLSEIIITMELSNLRHNKRNGMKMFTEVQKIQCVQGKYPEQLLMLWDEYDENRGSENDCPEVFKDDQLYIIFQMGYGGKDLESFEFTSAMQAFSMFQQVAIGLAVAEEELQFEHRDLHWGNVLISTVESNKFASFTLDNHNYEIPTMGVEVAIIDFTLSRIEYDGVVIFNDLSLDPDLFTADGDYQFEIYRLMQQRNGNLWKDFEPFTNILWLHYILDKAILGLRYKNIKTKRHKEYLRKLKILKEDILCFNNVKEFAIAKFL